ncbi:hypothetical protein [Yoonia sediminilitoris]|uniref:Uncharacterized protein n=1 Tax=Yoonia sediminilitoris TaxID=1286148 RepID=A0A2T6KPG3_9RHOB|nr:hypothetical protein [Yoonia sediminilitoris]PUB18449.1 hypothetical protein C8N45_10133 [Yoonia sediminilitoris]RCW98617.1 hypothetical protein DFP92_10133 [Yoonia sediminilitoris]
MLISRTLARRRINAGRPTSRKQAWIPVALDTALIVIVLALALQPALFFVYYMQLSLFWLALFFFILFFLPAQIVIVISTIWAVRSRWIDQDERTNPNRGG